MRRACGLAFGTAVVLAACASAPGFRDTRVPITSIAAFDVARFAGTWHEVARFSAPVGEDCAAVVDYTRLSDGALGVARRCRDGSGTGSDGRAVMTGPGRFDLRLAGAKGGEGYWVLWVDESYRTAVIGQPSGRSGHILNRDPAIPADRLQAAREILDWNGYDVARLRLIAPEAP